MTTRSNTTQQLDFDILVQEHQAPITRYLLARTGSRTETADLVQETFVRAYCALSRGDQPKQPLFWLLTIARNVFIESLRKQQRHHQMCQQMAVFIRYGLEPPWQDKVEQRLIIGNAVDALPDDLREPILLHYFAGLSLSEVASHLEITPGAVKTRLWRAQQTLRVELETIMSDNKRQLFSLPNDLADKAKLLAEKPPVYPGLDMIMHVGGQYPPVAPWAKPQTPLQGLSMENLRLAVEKIHALRIAGDRPLTERLHFWGSQDVFYHSEPITVWSFLNSANLGFDDSPGESKFLLIPTDGWALGTRPDARKILVDFKENIGLSHVWFTIGGLAETHDKLAKRPGAFAAIVKAWKLCTEMGIAAGANLLLTKHSAKEVTQLCELFAGPLSSFLAYPLAPAQDDDVEEDIYCEPEDLVGLPPKDPGLVWHESDVYKNPEAFTEAALTRAALESGLAKDTEHRGSGLDSPTVFWVDANLELLRPDFDWNPKWPISNLGKEPSQKLYEVLVNLPWPPEPPSYRELAQRYGNLSNRKMASANVLKGKWIKCWLRDNNTPWMLRS
jgi:RNA polymerase sigma-70 factor, ECF subfamily